MKHTNGPWTANFLNYHNSMNGVGYYEVTGPKGTVCNCEESTIEETKANARLIAAAPEMLAWLKECIRIIETQNPDTYQGVAEHVNGLIARASGDV